VLDVRMESDYEGYFGENPDVVDEVELVRDVLVING
jgi:hypothetical protein